MKNRMNLHRSMTARMALFAVILLVVAVSTGYGGTRVTNSKMVTVEHAFSVGQTTMPAGQYHLIRRDGHPPMLSIHHIGGGAEATVEAVTRLAMDPQQNSTSRLVFDKVGGTSVLSEVWIAGEDGFAVCLTPDDHDHEIVEFEK